MAINEQLLYGSTSSDGSQRNNTSSPLDDQTRLSSSSNSSSTNSSVYRAEVELMVIQTLHRVLGTIIEPAIRRVVKEEIGMVQEKLLSSMQRKSGKKTSASGSRSFELKFLDEIPLSVFTGRKIEGEKQTPIRVALVDGLTGEIVKSEPEAAAKVEIVVLQGDFGSDEGDCWNLEEFNNKIIRERKGKKPILRGDTCVNLKQGIGSIGGIAFTHNQEWTKNSKFRLGARVIDATFGIRVKEAKTKSFLVKDRRSTLYQKHETPSSSDEVWRLYQIGKDGANHKRLRDANVKTVKDFLILHSINPKWLRKILCSVSDKMWKAIVDHAQTCTDNKGICLYRDPSSEPKTGVVFNATGQLIGLIMESQYIHIDQLSEDQKGYAQKLVRSASQHWRDVEFFDDEKTLIHDCFKSDIVFSSLQSPGLESPNGHSFGTSPIMDTHPGISSQVIKPPLISGGDTSHLKNLELPSAENVDLRHDNVFFMDQSPHHPFLVISASEKGKQLKTCDIEASPMRGYLQPDAAFGSFHLHGPERSNGPNFMTPQILDRNDHAQPSTSSQDIETSLIFVGATNACSNVDLSSNETAEMNYEDNFPAVQCSESPVVSPETMYLDMEFIRQFLNYDYNFQSDHPNIESNSEQPNSASDVVLVTTQGVSIRSDQSRWTQVSKLLRRVSIRERIGALEGIHVEKKQRCN